MQDSNEDTAHFATELTEIEAESSETGIDETTKELKRLASMEKVLADLSVSPDRE